MTSVPIYMQIVEQMLDRFGQGELTPGDRLAAERTLAEEFGVNRRTVRQALDVLERRGVIERRKGAGTFVSEPRIERGASEFFHFTERIRDAGLTPGSEVLSLHRVAPSPLVADKLELPAGATIYRCHRLRTINAQPIVVETFSIPAERFPDFERWDVGRRSVYELMRTEYGAHMGYAQQSLEAVSLSEIEAQWLMATTGAPAMLERRLAFDDRGRPVEYGTDLYCGNRVRFVTDAATVAMPIDVAESSHRTQSVRT